MNCSWICLQIGGREHYAVPRALHRQNALAAFMTDRWKIGGRFHPELANVLVRACNSRSLLFEAGSRVRGIHGWKRVMRRNAWFGRTGARWLKQLPDPPPGQTRVIFSYSYAALEIFHAARARGWKTVLGQIDPGPEEERIVEQLHANSKLQSEWQPAPLEYWKRWKEECALADAIVVNSDWSRKAIAKELPDCVNKFHEIPLAYKPPAEAKTFARTYPNVFTQRRPLRVLFLGQIILRKGIEPLLQAAQSLEQEPIEFWIAGPLGVRLEQEQYDRTNIRWLGRVSQTQAAHYYQQADVFILPTFSDGFALTQLEAQAWKSPVIASRHCGSVVQDQINGLILNGISADAICAALQYCLQHPEQLQQWSTATIDFAAADSPFTLEAVGRKLVDLTQ